MSGPARRARSGMTGGLDELRFRAAGVLGPGLMASLFATIRCRPEGAEHYLQYRRRKEPVIFVCWHGHLLPLVHHHRGQGIVVLVSDHADGEYLTRVIERCGFATARGSSTRGGVKGLRELLRAAREGRDLALTPDGPQGPRGRFKWGALLAGQLTGHPIIPVRAGASGAWFLRSWDLFMIPKPLSSVRIEYLPPVRVPRHASEGDLRRYARDLEAGLNRPMAGVVAPAREAESGEGEAEAEGAESEPSADAEGTT